MGQKSNIPTVTHNNVKYVMEHLSKWLNNNIFYVSTCSLFY